VYKRWGKVKELLKYYCLVRGEGAIIIQSTEKERREAGVISMGAYARVIDRRSLTGGIDM
jgi:hypothetical protein